MWCCLLMGSCFRDSSRCWCELDVCVNVASTVGCTTHTDGV